MFNDNLKTMCKQMLIKFRGGLLDLRANMSRFESIPFHRRICQVFNSGIETEFRYLLVCLPIYYLILLSSEVGIYPSLFYMYLSEIKFKVLMNRHIIDLKTKIVST